MLLSPVGGRVATQTGTLVASADWESNPGRSRGELAVLRRSHHTDDFVTAHAVATLFMKHGGVKRTGVFRALENAWEIQDSGGEKGTLVSFSVFFIDI